MRKWHGLDRLREAAVDYPGSVGMILVGSVAIGTGLAVDTGSILKGLIATVGTILICIAIWPLIKWVDDWVDDRYHLR